MIKFNKMTNHSVSEIKEKKNIISKTNLDRAVYKSYLTQVGAKECRRKDPNVRSNVEASTM